MLPEQAHIAWKRLSAELETAENLGAKNLPIDHLRKHMKDLEAGVPVQASFLSEDALVAGRPQESAKSEKTAPATATAGEVVKTAPGTAVNEADQQHAADEATAGGAAAADGKLPGGFQAPGTEPPPPEKKRRGRQSKTEATDTRFK